MSTSINQEERRRDKTPALAITFSHWWHSATASITMVWHLSITEWRLVRSINGNTMLLPACHTSDLKRVLHLSAGQLHRRTVL